MSSRDHEPSVRATWRQRAALPLKTAVSVLLIAWVVSGAGVHELVAALRASSGAWLAAGWTAGTVAALLQANQWRGLLNALGLPRTYARCLHLDTAGRVFDAVLPTSIGGDVVRVALVGAAPSQRAAAACSVILRRLASLPGLALIMGVGLALSWRSPFAGRVRPLAGLLAGGLLGLVLLLVLLVRLRHSLRLPRRVLKVVDSLTAVRAATPGQPSQPIARAAARGLAFWLVVCLSQWCFIRGVGSTAPFVYSSLVVATVNALSMLPISLGGYGLREGAYASLLAVGGLATTAQGAAVGVCLSIQTLAFGIAGGIAYLSLGRTRPARQDDRPPSTTTAPAVQGAQ